MSNTDPRLVETLSLLHKLRDDRVMVTALLRDGASTNLFDSPQSGADAIVAVLATACTGLVDGYVVRRDETALGLTR